jgi:hypothetical protein
MSTKSFGIVSLPAFAALLVGAAATARADIAFLDSFKNIGFEQTGNGNSLTSNGDFYSADLNTTIPNSYASVTMTYPGPGSPLNIPQVTTTDYHFQTASFSNQAAMDAAFPFGTYSFTGVGGTTDTATYSYTADDYPASSPFLTGTDFTSLQGMNSALPFTMHLSPFVTGTNASLSFIFVTVFDETTNTTVFNDGFLPPSTTTVVIPGGTLTPGDQFDYEIDYSNRDIIAKPRRNRSRSARLRCAHGWSFHHIPVCRPGAFHHRDARPRAADGPDALPPAPKFLADSAAAHVVVHGNDPRRAGLIDAITAKRVRSKSGDARIVGILEPNTKWIIRDDIVGDVHCSAPKNDAAPRANPSDAVIGQGVSTDQAVKNVDGILYMPSDHGIQNRKIPCCRVDAICAIRNRAIRHRRIAASVDPDVIQTQIDMVHFASHTSEVDRDSSGGRVSRHRAAFDRCTRPAGIHAHGGAV